MKNKTKRPRTPLPEGSTEEGIAALAHYYDNQSEDDAAAEYELGLNKKGYTWIPVPNALVSDVRQLLSGKSKPVKKKKTLLTEPRERLMEMQKKRRVAARGHK